MQFRDMVGALEEARRAKITADGHARDMAKIIKGNLRAVNSDKSHQGSEVLRALKKELRDFNSTTGKWNNEL